MICGWQLVEIMVGSLLLLSVFHVTFSVNVNTNPSQCIFGSRDSGCLYPCHCQAGSEEGCDPFTGKCSSGLFIICFIYLIGVSFNLF